MDFTKCFEMECSLILKILFLCSSYVYILCIVLEALAVMVIKGSTCHPWLIMLLIIVLYFISLLVITYSHNLSW